MASSTTADNTAEQTLVDSEKERQQMIETEEDLDEWLDLFKRVKRAGLYRIVDQANSRQVKVNEYMSALDYLVNCLRTSSMRLLNNLNDDDARRATRCLLQSRCDSEDCARDLA